MGKIINHSISLNVKAFTIGMLFSFIGLSLCGWLFTEKNIFKNFQRFHRNITSETQFYPTPRIMTALVNSQIEPNKITVIISGSSKFRGAGQSLHDLWSIRLQEQLGDNFKVINLAQNGGRVAGIGLYMAEFLAKKGIKVIFVVDVGHFSIAVRDDGPNYPGFFLDGENRGYWTHFPERLDRIKTSLNSEILLENLIKVNLNQFIYFNDFWNAFGYLHFFTVLTPQTFKSPFSPRINAEDKDDIVSCNPELGYNRDLDGMLNIMRTYSVDFKNGSEFDPLTDFTVPDSIKKLTIFSVGKFSPYYIKKISLKEKENYLRLVKNAALRYQELGIQTFIPSYPSNNYCDLQHFSAEGAKKLSHDFAYVIKSKAKVLGYE